MTVRIPTFCEHCGHVWTGNEIALGDGASVTMSNNQTQCPSCNEMTPMLDGTFAVSGGRIHLADGPIITQYKLDQIARALESLTADEDFEVAVETADQTVDEGGLTRKIKDWVEQKGGSTIRTVADLTRVISFLRGLF